MKNILTEALVNSATNASFIFSYTNSAKLRLCTDHIAIFNLNMELCIDNPDDIREEEDGVMWVNQGVTYWVRTA